ncbi:sporulation protein [Bacillus sp. AK031]
MKVLLRKYMSLIGIGSARIDLQLPKYTFQAGETVIGCFYIEGGTVDQQINRIECDLVMTDTLSKKETVINTATILSSAVVKPQERNQRKFTFRIPPSLQASSETVRFQFKTRLFFDEGMESKDQDIISVL